VIQQEEEEEPPAAAQEIAVESEPEPQPGDEDEQLQEIPVQQGDDTGVEEEVVQEVSAVLGAGISRKKL
jgi:hypothetical protein